MIPDGLHSVKRLRRQFPKIALFFPCLLRIFPVDKRYVEVAILELNVAEWVQ